MAPRSIRSTIAMLAIACWSGCGGRSTPGSIDQPERRGLRVLTVNYPLKYLADRIGGEQVEAVLPAPADIDPAFWTPDVETLLEYQQADLILLNGAGYASWVSQATLPRSKLVNTSESFQESYIVIDDAVSHSHGPGVEHKHGGVAFTTWLDPELALAQAQAIHQAFVESRPEQQALFDRNFQSLKSDLSSLDQRLKAAVGAGRPPPVIFSHPVYQYLQRRCQLNGRSVHWEPDVLAAEAEWVRLAKLLESHPAGWMIWEGEPIAANVERLNAMNVRSVVFDPCANQPASGDWLDVMNRNAQSLEKFFAESKDPAGNQQQASSLSAPID